MGYSTDFAGQFTLNKPLDAETKTFLTKLAETRRMKRDPKKIAQIFGGTPEQYGVEGEFFVGGEGFAGQDSDASVVDSNRPPRRQPGLWCQWVPNEDGTAIQWDGGEKFYSYVQWLTYIIAFVLGPKGYSLTGDVVWQGEETGDVGVISVKDNIIKTYPGVTSAPQPKIETPEVKAKVPREPKTVKMLGNDKGEKFIELRELVELIQYNADGFKKGSTERATLLVLIDKIKDL